MSARILVLDDDPSVRLFLSKILSRAGFEVTAVETGSEALQQLRTSRFDGFLVDKNLPGEHGLDVLAEARKLDSALPAVMITAYPEPLLRAGVRLQGYLAKPFESITKVVETVKRNVEMRALLTPSATLRRAELEAGAGAGAGNETPVPEPKR